MKKLIIVAALAYAGLASAGEYHKGEALKCSQCHTMHASRAHNFNNGSAYTTTPLSANPKLLIQASTNQTCLACHDGQHYPDVFGADFNAAWNRSAGALNGNVPGHTSPGLSNPLGQQSTYAPGVIAYADWMGHTLGSTATPPGFSGATFTASANGEGFNCSNCHAVHGSAAFRNAGKSPYMGYEEVFASPTSPFAAAGASYSMGIVDLTKDVSVLNGNSKVTADITFGAGTGGNGMNAFCAACHGNFHGDANTKVGGTSPDFIRHPTTGVARTDGLLTTAANSPAMNAAQTDLVRPAWINQTAKTFEVACLTCHKAHGNARGFGLLYPSHINATVDFENGDSATIDAGSSREYFPIRSLCITCHPMGR